MTYLQVMWQLQHSQVTLRSQCRPVTSITIQNGLKCLVWKDSLLEPFCQFWVLTTRWGFSAKFSKRHVRERFVSFSHVSPQPRLLVHSVSDTAAKPCDFTDHTAVALSACMLAAELNWTEKMNESGQEGIPFSTFTNNLFFRTNRSWTTQH